MWRARQVTYDREVAVKVLDSGIEDEDGRRRFQRECATTGRVTGHPNIVTLLDSGFLADGRPFLTMDLCDQGSYGDRLAREGQLPVADVTRVGVKVAGALHTAHQRGVLHRDIKPENILVTSFGEPALADFGISTLTDRAAAAVTAAYTPSHAPPEVLRGEAATVASDVYNLGSTLYQLLAGRPAFVHAGDVGLARFVDQVLNADPPPMPRDDVSAPVVAAVLAAMAKDPAARPASAEAFGQLLREAEASAGLPVTELLVGGLPTDAVDPAVAEAAVAGLAGAAAAAAAGDGGSGATEARPAAASERIGTTEQPDLAEAVAVADGGTPAASGPTVLPPRAPDIDPASSATATGEHTIMGGRAAGAGLPPSGPGDPGDPTGPGGSDGGTGGRKKILVALVVAIVMIATGVGGFLLVNGKDDPVETVTNVGSTTKVERSTTSSPSSTSTSISTTTSTTAVPATLPPVTQPPVTQPPVTQPPVTTTALPALSPGDSCDPDGPQPNCIDPDGDGSGTYLLLGDQCEAEPFYPGGCEDLDGDGTAGYGDSG